MRLAVRSPHAILLASVLLGEGLVIALESIGLDLRSSWFAFDWDPINFFQSGGYGVVMVLFGALMAAEGLYGFYGGARHGAWIISLLVLLGMTLFADVRMFQGMVRPWVLFVLQTIVFLYIFACYLTCVAWDDAARR
jgi:hypothetical protein